MRRLLVVIGLALFGTSAVGQEPKPTFTERFELGEIRMLYLKDGKDAVDPADVDKNGVPDQVEDTAKQAWATYHLYCETLGFPDPLKSKRYEGVRWIEITIWHKDRMDGLNGVAFDEPQRSANQTDPPGSKAIVAAVGNHFSPIKNASSSHEVFHLIQYGATYFKVRWFLEGQARWSEFGLGKGGIGDVKYNPRGPWPHNPNDLKIVFDRTYDADFVLWYPLAKADDKRGLIPAAKVSKELKALKYSNGELVLRDLELVGADVMSEILNALGEADDIAFQKLGYDSWSEDNQRSAKNSPFVYQAIMDVMRRRKHKVGKYSAN